MTPRWYGINVRAFSPQGVSAVYRQFPQKKKEFGAGGDLCADVGRLSWLGIAGIGVLGPKAVRRYPESTMA